MYNNLPAFRIIVIDDDVVSFSAYRLAAEAYLRRNEAGIPSCRSRSAGALPTGGGLPVAFSGDLGKGAAFGGSK